MGGAEVCTEQGGLWSISGTGQGRPLWVLASELRTSDMKEGLVGSLGGSIPPWERNMGLGTQGCSGA